MPRIDASTQTPQPSAFICPITHAVMREPVLLVPSGITYESSAIRRWLERSPTCPLSRCPATPRDMVRNRALEAAISQGPVPPAPSDATPATERRAAAAAATSSPPTRTAPAARTAVATVPAAALPAAGAIAPTLMSSAANIRAAAAARASAARRAAATTAPNVLSSAANLRAAAAARARAAAQATATPTPATAPNATPNAEQARTERAIWALERTARSTTYLVQAGFPRFAAHRRSAETSLQNERANLARLQGQ